MKKSIKSLAILVFVVLSANAQTVSKRETLAQTGFNPVLNVDGDKLLYTASGFSGLNLVDLKTNAIVEISKDAGAGYEPQFSTDNAQIYYRKTTFENNRRFNAVQSYDLKTKRNSELLTPQRLLNKIYPLNNGVVAFSGKNILRATATKSNATPVVVSANEELKIMLYNGKISYLNPLNMPEPRYIWVSLSPDSKKILFTAAGKGTYICDLNGKILSSLGSVNAPVWFNDNFVVAMEDKDDGHRVISSKIVLISVAKKTKTDISLPSKIAMYPTASGKANRISYHTEDGDIEVVDVKF
jgi:hypothetical protein